MLVRAGHTEAAVDVSRLAGLNPSGVICEIMREDGTMARLDDLMDFARVHGLKIGTIRDLIAYRLKKDHLVERVATSPFIASSGAQWQAQVFRDKSSGEEQLALVHGAIDPSRPTLVRMHSLDLFADILDERGEQSGVLQGAMRMIEQEGLGRGRRAPRRGARLAVARHRPALGQAGRGRRRGPRLWHRRADPRRARHPRHDPAVQQPPFAGRPVRLWPRDRRGTPDRAWPPEMSTILLVEARFYPHLNDMLLEGARAAIEAAGHKHETLTVPGALELPGAIALAARSGRFCAFVALGVVIRGETYHFELVSNESARGLMDLTLQGYAIGNGVLTVENEAQAIVRADPRQADKGGGAAKAALALFELREKYAP